VRRSALNVGKQARPADLLNVSGVMNASGDTLQLPKEQRFKRSIALGWLQFLLTENSCSASAEGPLTLILHQLNSGRATI
jgi:hypothetical protein